MQNVLIKIIGQPHFHPTLTVDLGPGYAFHWNESIQAYAFAPKTQAEVDDIFLSTTLHGVWQFAPHFIGDFDGASIATTATQSPAVTTDDTAFLQEQIKDITAQRETAIKRIEELKKANASMKAEYDKIMAAAGALNLAPSPEAKAKRAYNKKPKVESQPAAIATEDDIPTE